MKLALVVFASVVMVGCSSATPCEAGSCTGCCDSSGTCRPGNLNTQCGAAGAACAACEDSQSCVSQTCGAPLGGGTGTGGGGGTMADAGPCTVIPWTTQVTASGAFNEAVPQRPAHNVGLQAVDDGDGGTSLLTVELWYFAENESAVVPWPVTLSPTTSQGCATCVYLERGCTPSGTNCAEVYLAQGGALNFTRATKNASSGEFAASGTTVTLYEWNLAVDAASSGRCVQLDFAIDSTWDAGVPDGGPGDGG